MSWTNNQTQLKSDWDKNGFGVVRNFMSLEEVSNLRSEIERYIAKVVPCVPEHEVMYEENGKPENTYSACLSRSLNDQQLSVAWLASGRDSNYMNFIVPLATLKRLTNKINCIRKVLD